MSQPWERLPEENNRWYQRFDAFKLLGPGRTLIAIYNRERVAAGRNESAEVSGAWRKKVRLYRWVERAEAWDKYLTDQREAEYLAERARVDAQWEAEVMRRPEILGRLSRMGRARPHDFFTWSPAGRMTGFNMQMLEAHGDLVKKMGSKETSNGPEFMIELYDGQAATVKMGQHEKLFTDQVEHSGTVNQVEMTLDQWKAAQQQARAQVAETMGVFEDGEEPSE